MMMMLLCACALDGGRRQKKGKPRIHRTNELCLFSTNAHISNVVSLLISYSQCRSGQGSFIHQQHDVVVRYSSPASSLPPPMLPTFIAFQCILPRTSHSTTGMTYFFLTRRVWRLLPGGSFSSGLQNGGIDIRAVFVWPTECSLSIPPSA